MGFFHKTILVFTLILASQAKAFTPESGFWWNPDEPGSGYSIEIQDNYLFMALYVYDEFGNPFWYTASKTMGGNSLFDAVLDYTYNGPCIDCSYSQPITIIGERGPITINFLTETTATLQFQGAVKNIERFNFLLGDELTKMRGEWQVVVDPTNYFPNEYFFADVLIFDDEEIFDGLDLVTGCRSESTTFSFCTAFANLSDVAAYYDQNDGYLYAVVDHSESDYMLYRIKTGLDQFDGDAYVYLKGTEPDLNFDGYLVRGFRSASRSFIDTGTGPNLTVETEQKSKTRDVTSKLPLSKVSIENFESSDKSKEYTIIKKLEQILQKNSNEENLNQ
ncbi:MAG: hypothetical protein AB8B80_01020 [Marinicellaceae bacterium]